MTNGEMDLLKNMKELQSKMQEVGLNMSHYQDDRNLQLAGRINNKATELIGASLILQNWIEEIENEIV